MLLNAEFYSIGFSFTLKWFPLSGWSVTFQCQVRPNTRFPWPLSLNSLHFWAPISLGSSLFCTLPDANSDLYLINQQLTNCLQYLTCWQYGPINITYCHSKSLDEVLASREVHGCSLCNQLITASDFILGCAERDILCSRIVENYTLVYSPFSWICASPLTA